jgi:hypothetical protein
VRSLAAEHGCPCSMRCRYCVFVVCCWLSELCWCWSSLRNDSEPSAERVRLGFFMLLLFFCVEFCSSNVFICVCP